MVTGIQGGPAVPFVFNNVFEQDVLHVTIAETAEQTGHNRSLRNPSALTIRSARDKDQVTLLIKLELVKRLSLGLCTFPWIIGLFNIGS